MKKSKLNKMYKYRIGTIQVQSENINDLKDFAEELGELAKASGTDLSKHLNDTCFAIDVDYQNYHNLDQDDWEKIH